MFELIANGIPWRDADGQEYFEEHEAIRLCAALQTIGYNVAMIQHLPGQKDGM